MKPSAKLRLLEKKIKNVVFQAQKKAARELVQIIIDMIKIRTRLESENVDGKIPRNEASTKKYRQRYSDNLHPDTSPGASNATATGQMLDAMKGRAVGTKITIDLAKGKRKGELSGGKSKLTNNEVRAYYEELKGEWLGLSKQEIDDAIDYATEIIKQEIRSSIK